MAQDMPPNPVFLRSFVLVSYLLGNAARVMPSVGRLNLTPVAHLCGSSF